MSSISCLSGVQTFQTSLDYESGNRHAMETDGHNHSVRAIVVYIIIVKSACWY